MEHRHGKQDLQRERTRARFADQLRELDDRDRVHPERFDGELEDVREWAVQTNGKKFNNFDSRAMRIKLKVRMLSD